MGGVFRDLEDGVIKRGFCLGCGACVAACPVQCLSLQDGTPTLQGKCINCGVCYEECLHTAGFDRVGKQWKVEMTDPDLGPYLSIHIAESPEKAVKERAQDGGAVTAMLKTLLEYEYVDGAIVTGVGAKPLQPEGKVVTTPDEVEEYAGSKYCRGPLFTAVREAVRHYGRSRLALVGLPCQIATLRRIQTSNPTNRQLAESVKLAIGLFCEGAFQYRFFREVVEGQARIPLAEVERVEVSGDKVIVYRMQKPPREIALAIAKKYIDLACRVCTDFSAVLADISVGAAGSPKGKSTVIIRTNAGADAFNFVARMNGIKTKPLEVGSGGIEEIRKASQRKKDGAKRTLERLRASKQPVPLWAES